MHKIIKKIKLITKTNITKTKYVEWEEYKNKINFLDTFNWQQSVRKQSLKNIKPFF